MDYQYEDWSPRSARSGSSTPPSTPPMKDLDEMDDSDENPEENYSPVCSDDEWGEGGIEIFFERFELIVNLYFDFY